MDQWLNGRFCRWRMGSSLSAIEGCSLKQRVSMCCDRWGCNASLP
jgi:hypothetical protein